MVGTGLSKFFSCENSCKILCLYTEFDGSNNDVGFRVTYGDACEAAQGTAWQVRDLTGSSGGGAR